MAKTFNQLKKTVGGLGNSGLKESKDEKKAFKDIKISDYDFSGVKSELEKTIRLDSLESDLSSMGKTIEGIYNGWQTQETMNNTRTSVEAMQNRLSAYKEYSRLFGGADVSKNASNLVESYGNVLNDWDNLSKVYGNYKNADAFNTAKKNAQLSKRFEGLSYDEVQTEKKKYKEDSDEYKFLDTYTGYTDLNDFDKALKSKKDDEFLKTVNDYKSKIKNLQERKKAWERRANGLNADGGYGDKIKATENEFQEYLKSMGYNEDTLNKFLDENKSHVDNLEIERNKYKLNHGTYDLYKDYTTKEDFAEKSKYVSTKGNYDNLWDKFTEGQYSMGYGDVAYEYINGTDEMRQEIIHQQNTYGKESIIQPKTFSDRGYDKLNPNEVLMYNYLSRLDKENGTKKAQEFLDGMEMTLTKRVYDKQTQRWEDAVETPMGAIAHSVLSVPASVYGAIPTAMESIADIVRGKEYNPYSSYKVATNYASDTRKYVGENIEESTEGMELFGTNVPSFLYSTGMSLADNLLGANTLGKGYLPLMSTNAFHQKAKEMTEAGEDTATIYATAFASGAAEMIFEKFSLDHFLKMKNVDGLGNIIKSTLTQAGIEASEEFFTELSNIFTDTVIRGDNSELAQFRKDLASRGFSENEINTELAKKIGSQLFWASTGGALSGGGMGFVGSLGNYYDVKSKGSEIKSNERVSEVFDIASNPEVASAYDAYTRYAKKGINADNISDAKLGNLYSMARADAVETLNSKKSTDEQRSNAMKTLAKLSVVETENTVKKDARERFNVGEETKVTESGDTFDIKDLKIKEGKATFDTEKGEISAEDVTLTQNDAELVVLAEGIAETDGKDIANLFISQYDGKTNAEEYANAFNLATAYAKNNFTYDTILKNKGVLSTDQVKAIYSETRIKADKEAQNTINKLNEKMADTMTYKGFIVDSAITEEVWNKLDKRQQQAVTFIKGFAQATGMNLILKHNPESKHGGAYDVNGNTITIDVAKYKHIEKGLMETIIPTMSHETTHWMEEKSPELWRNMNALVFSTLQEADGINEETRIQIEQARLKKKGRKGTVKEARSEIIARACEDMLSMSEQGKKMFNYLSESEQKTLVGKIREIIQNLKNWVNELLGTYKSDSYEAKIMRQYEDKLNRLSKLWDEMLKKSVVANQSLEKSGAFEHDITSIGTRNLNELSDAVGTDGESLFQYRAMVEDEDIYREMLLKHKDTIGITDKQITELFDTIDKAVDIISNNLEALDYAWETDIDDRAFSPVKPNSDTLYRVSLDFSTLCRKRLLQQTIQSTLQQALNKNLSKEESIAIRDELIKIQEEGRKIEVACALCYVEAARMKSPKQINKFLNNREDIIRDFFANKSGGSIKEKVANAELKARKKLQKDNPDGLVGKNGVILDALTAPKSKMTKADADYIRTEGKKVKESYKLTEHEQAELDVAKKMSADDFTSAKGLENLAKKHPDLFDAYTSFVRNATHSKGIENDTWWRAGDSNAIGDNLIAQMNAENGLRSQSWSDFQVIHLLDYIAATIELSTKGAKRQSYTKVPDYVKLLGNTGDMINMSLIPERVFDGKLSYDGVEGMAYDIAKQLRDEYHETVGTICIGIENEQIRLLLEDNTIDMVIPYHHSSMSKATRKLMHIPTWVTYEKSQNESKLSDADAKANAEKYGVEIKKDNMYQKSPNFSEWFNLEEARQIAKLENEHPSDMDAYKKYGKMYGGYIAMQNAANNYLKLCAERGLSPKFSSKDADFTKDANYWKLLTDRKMVDNVTGEIIEQKPIKPIFNEKHILEILNDELARYPQVKADQEYAQRKVVEKFLSGEMNVDQSTLDAIKKPIDNVTEVNILESSADGVSSNDGMLFSMRDTVEETEDLIACHNISEKKLMEALMHGQMVMPSIAITNKSHTDFGDISIVFGKETINPETDKSNKLYGADAWTPTQTTLKLNPKFDKSKTKEVVKDIKKSIGKNWSQIFDINSNQFENTITSAKGDIYSSYAENIGMQTAYAMKNGIISSLPMKNGNVDVNALKDTLDANLNKDEVWREYKKWLEGISNTIITSYDKASTQDILNSMKAQPDTAKNFNLSENGELTVPAVEYHSVDELRKNKGRLSENADIDAKQVGAEFISWASNISTKTGMEIKNIVKVINSSFNSRYDVSEIEKTFNESGIHITESYAASLQALYKKAVELPTRYFEAKPQRTVGFNEVAKVILPNNASTEIKTKLDDMGVTYLEYEAGNENARLDALNSLEEVRFSDRDIEVIDIPFDMYSTMENHFGTTKNFDVAGYMLRDGKMLDFSGKHWGATDSDFRQVDHRDIQEVLEDNHNGVQAMMSMISNGNIRLMPEVGGINLSNMPNGFQSPVLRDYINHFKGEVVVDIDEVGGDTIHSFEYSKGTSASKILSDLEGYFHRGEMPSRTKSSVAEFLYSDRDSDEEITINSILNNGKKSDKIEEKGSIEFGDEFDSIFNKAISKVAITKVNMKVFPPFDKSHSDANEQATRWAHNEDVETGAQAIVFYHNRSYVIEKFDSTDLKYVIKGHIKYDDYRNIRRELESNAKNGESKSIEELATIYDKRNRQRDYFERRRQSADSVAIEHRGKSNTIQRVDKDSDNKREIQSNSYRGDERNSTNKQTMSEKRITTETDNIMYSDRPLEASDLSNLNEFDLTRDALNISLEITSLERQLKNETLRNGRSIEYINEMLINNKDKYVVYAEFVLNNNEKFTPQRYRRLLECLVTPALPYRVSFDEYTTEELKSTIESKRKEYIRDSHKALEDQFESGKMSPTEKRIYIALKMMAASEGYEFESNAENTDVGNDNDFLDDELLFSDRDDTSVYDLMGEKERILEENEKFKAEIERLKERLKIERKVTHGNYFNENQLGTVAGHLRNIAKSTYSKEKLVDSLKDVYSFIAHSPELAWEDVFGRSYRIAEDILTEAKPITIVDGYYKQMLENIRNTRISLSESQKKEAQYLFGKNWNRNFFGKVIITDKGLPLDSQWQEWSSIYPGFFDADVNDADMVGQLYDTLNSLKEASETVDEYAIEEQKRWLAREIYNQYWNVSPIRTTADKYDKQIRLLNFEHRRIMTEFREEYNSRLNSKLKEQRKADKERYKKLVDKIRERKDKEIAFAKEHGREKLHTYKENAERKTRIQRITANALSLNEMLIKNSKDKHVPEIMREPVTALLQAIDFSSKRLLEKGEPTQKDISLSKALSKVKDMMVKATNAHDELVELYGHGLDEDIEKMVDSVDDIMRSVGDNEFVINRMTLTDLQTLDKVIKTIKYAVNKLNKFHTVNHARGIANLSQESVLYLDSLGKGKIYDGIRGATKKLLDWGNALPYYVFKRYGSGGMKVYEALQDGWDKFAFNTKKIIDYANESYTSKEVKEWSEEVKTFKILIPATEYDLAREDYVPQYQEVQLTVPQIMSMYCLNKREQARGHLFKGGIRVADFKDKKGKIVSQSEGVVFTEKDVRNIFDSLSARQKSVANKLQEFMNTVCADWGNEVSMARFGYKAFGEENYFPIQSDKNNLAVNDETEQPNSLFKLLNMSFTKSTIEKANNRIVISDIFDVFAQHTSDMAKYNALALPVLDSFKWYNYTEKEDIAEGTFKTRGVKQSIEKAFGKDGQNYFTTFLKDINGQQEVSRDTLGNGFFKNAKLASVGMNLRVVLLQPTSYARASAVIDNKYLTKALVHKPKIKRAETHCGIALWKSMGYYDTNIQRGVEAQIKHSDTWKDKATNWSMKGAEIADKVTWGYLWNACELEVRDKQKDLKVGSKEFYDAIGKRLREVIYATQVVDSTMTRSQMMRSTDSKDKLLTAFASEPTLSYNMLQDAYMELSLDARRMGKKEAFKKNGKRIARIMAAYTMTNVLAALIESGFDALRDDDDEEMDMIAFMKLYLKNFASDMSITGKIPYIKELHSMIQGFGSSRSDTQWMEETTKAITTWYKVITTGKGKPSTAIKYSIKGISDLSGLPFYNIYRDTIAVLNKLDLFSTDDLNEMFEDFLD